MAERMVTKAYWGYHLYTLKSGVLAEKGKMAAIDTADGSVTKGATSTTLIPLGIFAETLTGNGTLQIQVELFEEIVGRWWNNDTGAAVTAAMLGQACYIKDDQTVTSLSTGASKAGTVMAVDAIKGVLVHSIYPFA
jgi:hypothetical protein